MVDQTKDEGQEAQKVISSVEKQAPITEREARFEHGPEGIPVPEKTVSPNEKIVSEELRREIEIMELSGKTKAEADKKAKKIEFLGEKEKIEHLLEIAREKGVVFAIQVAKRTNEPYLLDVLHDILAKEGYYQKFGQTTSDDDQSQATQSNSNSTNSK